ncbi:MAG: cytochrome c3 family protein [Candidatus Eisenbacteria bacterium]|uniref:Cytochrome c3 family protein n=1 Tax=Eiseniibacteriota bacterium TaxID=2212470 RepID=A0A956M1I2_UNCEI|nr:cytochrome c3 family protein [Candidatus Eisenbacteria bacterium]
MSRFMFPKWLDALRPLLVLVLAGTPAYVLFLVYYGFWPTTRTQGYMPLQPVPYSHAVHVGKLGMDCRYCHTGVESSAAASIPPTATCMNCHTAIWPDSPKLQPVRDSYATGEPVQWIRVHDLPDFVYFNHSAHVTRGIGCVSCHGRIDKMDEVYQEAPISMAWCLDCHRNPEKNLRPVEFVTSMDWVPNEDQLTLGARLAEANNIHPSTDCSTCHR